MSRGVGSSELQARWKKGLQAMIYCVRNSQGEYLSNGTMTPRLWSVFNHAMFTWNKADADRWSRQVGGTVLEAASNEAVLREVVPQATVLGEQ
jgi:hypothetical protein